MNPLTNTDIFLLCLFSGIALGCAIVALAESLWPWEPPRTDFELDECRRHGDGTREKGHANAD